MVVFDENISCMQIKKLATEIMELSVKGSDIQMEQYGILERTHTNVSRQRTDYKVWKSIQDENECK